MSATKEATDQAKVAEAMRSMLSVSCGAFGRITGLAKVALYALESPFGVRDVDAMAELLGSITELADLASDAVQAEASWHDMEPDLAAWNRRDDARSKAKEITFKQETEQRALLRKIAADKAAQAKGVNP